LAICARKYVNSGDFYFSYTKERLSFWDICYASPCLHFSCQY